MNTIVELLEVYADHGLIEYSTKGTKKNVATPGRIPKKTPTKNQQDEKFVAKITADEIKEALEGEEFFARFFEL